MESSQVIFNTIVVEKLTKYLRTRGLSNTTSFGTEEGNASSRSLSAMLPLMESADSDIIIDLELATEVTHSVLDILEEILSLQANGKEWHEAYSTILVELISIPQSSVCSLLRSMKLFRSSIALLLPIFSSSALLATFCVRIPSLMSSGNLDVAKAAQLTIIKLMKEVFIKEWSITTPAYWVLYGITQVLGLYTFKDYAVIRNNRLGNLKYHLEESLNYESNDNVEFSKLYAIFAKNIITLVSDIIF